MLVDEVDWETTTLEFSLEPDPVLDEDTISIVRHDLIPVAPKQRPRMNTPTSLLFDPGPLGPPAEPGSPSELGPASEQAVDDDCDDVLEDVELPSSLAPSSLHPPPKIQRSRGAVVFFATTLAVAVAAGAALYVMFV